MTHAVDSKISEYYALRPTAYTSLESLTIRQGFGPSGVLEQYLSIALCKDGGDSDTRLLLEFAGVRRLEIRQPELSQITLPHVEILPGYSLPHINSEYLVRDPEQERILWFECRDFEARIQE